MPQCATILIVKGQEIAIKQKNCLWHASLDYIECQYGTICRGWTERTSHKTTAPQ